MGAKSSEVEQGGTTSGDAVTSLDPFPFSSSLTLFFFSGAWHVALTWFLHVPYGSTPISIVYYIPLATTVYIPRQTSLKISCHFRFFFFFFFLSFWVGRSQSNLRGLRAR